MDSAKAETAPVISVQPASQTVNVGETANFVAAASGDPTPTVQWQGSTDGAAGPYFNLDGETMPTLTWAGLNMYDGWWFPRSSPTPRGSATTEPAMLTVLGAPMISQQPADQTVNAGQNVSFSAAASGSPRPSGSWQVSIDGGATWSDYLDNTEEIIFTALASDNGKQFRAIFSNSLGSATSNAAKLTVNYPPVITQQPASQVAAPGAGGELPGRRRRQSGPCCPVAARRRTAKPG